MTAKRLGFFTRLLDDAPAGERYRLAVEQIGHAERHGFDSAWVAQHHFHRDEGGLPSPLPFLAYVAARTSRIRLGTGIIILPMEDPVRTAEDTVVVDLLSGGRLEVGLGTGATPETFLAFGLDKDERTGIFARNLDRLLAAWKGDALGHDKNRLYPEAGTLADRVWHATFSVAGAERIGRAGAGLMLSRTQPRSRDNPDATLPEIQHPIVDAYLANLPAGIPPRIMASRSLFVADSRAEALKLAEIGLNRVLDRFLASGHVIPDRSLPGLIRTLDTHVGAPGDVIASLEADSVLPRVTDIVFQVHSVDPPHPAILRSVELAATEVAPALGWRSSPREAEPQLSRQRADAAALQQ
ncbi:MULTISPECIES: putative FMN-dependent luciferase-like monooxygenase [unclassified Bosea (in: a-proteobacteria)]|uniref:putative FMN-dependent luciferase-like monooxygenase n=1 Tax=unclassified Bosea (in: a-proteobacteria) TaxID=2653178 RepID=UPI000F74CB18|nr:MULTISPECIES: putative FMN-dependent luciferase-like monooxygenase [unclassified Bosea (in: a-proteobacteria)]AZO80497.1 luciferase [Bosea sp. Tri-49]RXT23303.1 putative FMN-dependent luciferase-like monooxygenase [Bosea sp. Tri-39]RXT38776.1 putative FMN-dependent luciferase-like monooxygenase [Bosea sp. Tri-54]